MRCRLLAAFDRWCRAQCLTFAQEHGLTLPDDFDAGTARIMDLDRAAESRNNPSYPPNEGA